MRVLQSLLEKKRQAMVEQLQRELRRLTGAQSACSPRTVGQDTLHHFAIVARKRAGFCKLLEDYFPPLAIAIAPAFYSLVDSGHSDAKLSRAAHRHKLEEPLFDRPSRIGSLSSFEHPQAKKAVPSKHHVQSRSPQPSMSSSKLSSLHSPAKGLNIYE